MSSSAIDESFERSPSLTLRARIYAWAQLVRIPNVFTAIADVLAGATLAGAFSLHTIEAACPVVTLLVIVVITLYWTGMIWNDLNDIKQDRDQNRGRPLVDYRISIAMARNVARVLVAIAVAVVIGLAVTRGSRDLVDSARTSASGSYLSKWAPLIVTLMLVLCIRLYNSRLKLTFFGPVLMGLCRSGSFLLGVAAGCYLGFSSWDSLPHGWVAAIGHGVFVVGFTWAGRREAEQNESMQVAMGWGVAMLGLLTLALVPWTAPLEVPKRITPVPDYVAVFLLLALPLIRRAYLSIVDPSPKAIQLAIKQAIFSIVFFDAIVALQFGGPWPALAICSLIIPAIALGKFVSAT